MAGAALALAPKNLLAMRDIAGKRIVDRGSAQRMQEGANLENIVVRQLSLPGTVPGAPSRITSRIWLSFSSPRNGTDRLWMISGPISPAPPLGP
jgi:hypothetical protein